MKKKIKTYSVTFFKFLFAFSIIFFMIKTGKLDLGELTLILNKKLMLIEVIATMLGVYIIATIRWYYLLIWQGIPTTFRAVLRINCIGIFFNSFMPGSVGGDLVKAFYVARENKEYKTMAVVTIIVDRVLGLQTLMLVAFVAIIFNYKIIAGNPQLKALTLSIIFYLFISLIGALLVFSERVRVFFTKFENNPIVLKIPHKEFFIQVYEAFHGYKKQKIRLLKAILITVPLDILMIYIFYVIGRNIGENHMSLPSYFTAVPIGLLVISIPIAPAGIGVGQGAFYTLFSWFGASSGKTGAVIITIYQLITIAVNMCFSFFYISSRGDIQKALSRAKEDM